MRIKQEAFLWKCIGRDPPGSLLESLREIAFVGIRMGEECKGILVPHGKGLEALVIYKGIIVTRG